MVVNLRPDAEDTTEFVRFDHARVLRVLARIAADLDAVTRQDSATESQGPAEGPDPRTRHRKHLTESDEKPRGRTATTASSPRIFSVHRGYYITGIREPHRLLWFDLNHGGFPPDNVAQLPLKSLSTQHKGATSVAT